MKWGSNERKCIYNWRTTTSNNVGSMYGDLSNRWQELNNSIFIQDCERAYVWWKGYIQQWDWGSKGLINDWIDASILYWIHCEKGDYDGIKQWCTIYKWWRIIKRVIWPWNVARGGFLRDFIINKLKISNGYFTWALLGVTLWWQIAQKKWYQPQKIENM